MTLRTTPARHHHCQKTNQRRAAGDQLLIIYICLRAHIIAKEA